MISLLTGRIVSFCSKNPKNVTCVAQYLYSIMVHLQFRQCVKAKNALLASKKPLENMRVCPRKVRKIATKALYCGMALLTVPAIS